MNAMQTQTGTSTVQTIKLACGMPLIVEPSDTVASAALTWLLPVGSAADPHDGDGYSALLSELLFRGAGNLTSREFSDALDRLGVQRASSVGTYHMSISVTMLGDRLLDALPLIVQMVRQPTLDPEALNAVRSLCVQELESLNDDPQHLVMLRLREHHLPAPFNRHGYGDEQVLNHASAEQLREHWHRRAVPGGSILAVAGAVDPQALNEALDRELDGWTGDAPEPTEQQPAERGSHHDTQETAQVHLGLACDAPPEADENAMLDRLAIGVLSGGTSGRLFTEVRQKRGLCYSVGASYRTTRDWGNIRMYAGTTPQRAQETLDVCVEEFEKMRAGATQQEFDRATIGLKSKLIMQGESTGARSGALASDYFRLGRARSFDELAGEIDAVSLDQLNTYLASRRFSPLTMACIGPTALQMPEHAEAT